MWKKVIFGVGALLLPIATYEIWTNLHRHSPSLVNSETVVEKEMNAIHLSLSRAPNQPLTNNDLLTLQKQKLVTPEDVITLKQLMHQ